MTKTKKQFDFKLGADPEFILTMQGKKVDAKQTMQLMLKNKPELKYNDRKGGFEVKDCGDIGWDGASSTGEVRPSPSNDPAKIVDNLKELFTAFTNHIKICDLSTLSEFSSVGGHIHLEIPKGEKWTNEKRSTVHRKLASFYLPLLIAENKTNLNLRLRQNYGSIKDFRFENKFAHEDGTPGYTMEFRCPSAEWLTTPKIAKATLSYFGVIYHEILKHPKSFAKFNDIIYKSDKQGDALQTLAIMEYDLLTNGILKKAKSYIKTFEMYEQYKDDIEYIFNAKQVIKDKQKANFNIALGWNLIPETIPKKNEIFASKKKITKIAETKDFDMLKQVMNIHYNDDTNVGLFAENLKDRVAAFNWKLKNNYFIFGMRKGIDEIISVNLKNDFLSGKKLIKKIYDNDAINNLLRKMQQKFLSDHSNGMQNTTLDFVTGKPKDIRDSTIIIGIPYSMRINENIKPFINFIWSLEKGEIKGEQILSKSLKDDTNDIPEKRGEIYKILTKINPPTQQEVVIDLGSTSLRNHERTIAQMAMEANQDTQPNCSAASFVTRVTGSF